MLLPLLFSDFSVDMGEVIASAFRQGIGLFREYTELHDVEDPDVAEACAIGEFLDAQAGS